MNNITRKAAEILKNGGIIAYPTDTLFGIGCDIKNQKAIQKIFKLKGREYKKPMSIACSDIRMVKEYTNCLGISDQVLELAFPGPITLLLPKKESISDLVTAGSKKVGVRVPDYDIILKIIKKFGRPIITTSANISGQKDIADISELKINVDYVVPGKLILNLPSTIIDTANKEIVRRGAGMEKAKQILSLIKA